MNTELVILPDRYAKRTAVFVLTLAAVLMLLFWKSGVAGSNAVAAFSFTTAVSLWVLLTFETRISTARHRIVRVWRLGGLVPVWRQAYPFEALAGVQQLYIPEVQVDTWQVGLVTASGRFLMVTYFTTRDLKHPASEAARFQDYLSRALSLPVLKEEQAA